MAAAEAARLVVATADPPSHRTRRRGRGAAEEGHPAAGKSTAAACNGRDFHDLRVRARIQLGGPVVLVWDNVRLHLTKPLRGFIDANDTWLTVFQLPTYAPDLNPREGIWALVKRDTGNLAAVDLGQVTRVVKRRLKQIQYRPDLVNGCLAGTGLIMDG